MIAQGDGRSSPPRTRLHHLYDLGVISFSPRVVKFTVDYGQLDLLQLIKSEVLLDDLAYRSIDRLKPWIVCSSNALLVGSLISALTRIRKSVDSILGVHVLGFIDNHHRPGRWHRRLLRRQCNELLNCRLVENRRPSDIVGDLLLRPLNTSGSTISSDPLREVVPQYPCQSCGLGG